MAAIPFDKQQHRGQFIEWCKAHKMPVDEATMFDYLPDVGGFIVPDFGCIFVYRTSTPMAYIDMMMTNPTKTFEERRNAGRELIDAIWEFAEQNNIHMYSFCTDNISITHYAQYAGAFKLSSKPYEQWYWINPAFKR